MKYNPLIKAIQSVLGENGSIEFVIVDLNKTQIIETKPAQSASKEVRNETQIPYKKEEKPVEKQKEEFSEPSFEDTEKQDDIESYPQVTRQMLETFNGRVIE